MQCITHRDPLANCLHTRDEFVVRYMQRRCSNYIIKDGESKFSCGLAGSDSREGFKSS
jgi:hypothetical protein